MRLEMILQLYPSSIFAPMVLNCGIVRLSIMVFTEILPPWKGYCSTFAKVILVSILH
jgi:hypothetical protein